nr:hypothetical protein [uncultured Bacteroides sp.]
MNDLKGGISITTWICDYSMDKSLDYTIDMTESILKDNTVWGGYTTDPERSKAYPTPGCIRP